MLVRYLQSVGFAAEKTSRTGYTGTDLSVPLLGIDRKVEAKVRAGGFKELYRWLNGADFLVVRADRKPPLVVLPLRLAAEIAMAAEDNRALVVTPAEAIRGHPSLTRPLVGHCVVRRRPMPDTRVQHHHVAHSVYGPTGPRQDMPGGSPRPLSTKMRWHGEPPPPPASIAEHITSTVAKIPDLSAKQRASVTAAVTEMCRDLSFVRHIMDQMPRAPAQDEGRGL